MAKKVTLKDYKGNECYPKTHAKQVFTSNGGNIEDEILNKVDLSAIDLDSDTIIKIAGALIPAKYIVTQNGRNVGVMRCFGDNMGHMVSQVLTTHFTLPLDGSQHSDEKIFTYFRSYHISGGTSTIPEGTWGEWTLVYSSDNQKDIENIKEQIKKGVGGNKILEWNTDVATTRKQVPADERKAGLQISYQDADGNWVNEQYIGTAFDDDSWSDNANWNTIPNGKEVSDINNRVSDLENQLFVEVPQEDVILDKSYPVQSGTYRVVDNINLKANSETTLIISFTGVTSDFVWGFKQSSPDLVDIFKDKKEPIEYKFTPESDSTVYVWVSGSVAQGSISVKISQTKLGPSYIETINNNKERINELEESLDDVSTQLFGPDKIENVIVDTTEELQTGLYRVVDNIDIKAGIETVVSIQFDDDSQYLNWGLKMSSPVVQDILNGEYGNMDYAFTPESDSTLYVWISGGDAAKGTIKVRVTQNEDNPAYAKTIKESKEKIDSLDLLVRGLPDEYVLNDTFTIESSSAQRVVDNISLKANEDYEITCKGEIFSSSSIGNDNFGIKLKSSPSYTDLFRGNDAYNKTVSYRPEEDCLIYIWTVSAIVGASLDIKIVKKGKKSLEQKINGSIEVSLDKVDGVEDCSLENLFNPSTTLAYNSSFADKVYSAIGRKTGDTGCYSSPIPCKEGDYFTRTGLGTGIVVVMDPLGNILGDIKDASYNSTIQIKASEGQDFSAAASVSFVVMVAEKNDVKITKAKYVPTYTGDFVTIPRLQIKQENMSPDVITYVTGTSGKRYELQIDDSGDTPSLKFVALEGIPSSQLPSGFPKLKSTGDFSKYYDYIIFSMRNAGDPYIVQINSRGEVVRYLKKEINCFKTILENGKRYYYGATGSPNTSSGELLIYEEDGETFKQVGGAVRFTTGEVIEPHDTLIISVSEKHYILQRYVPNTTTMVDGQAKIVNALHVEEQYNGKQVWMWKSEDYPELWNDSNYQGNNDDYLHNNTICLDKDGNLCLNNKQANQILIIKRTWDDETHTGSIGDILWKIGGNSSKPTYDVPTRIKTTTIQQWYESHSALVNSNGLWNMFDNRSASPSRILEFEVDYESKTLKEGTFKAYTMKSYFGRYMGSADKLGEGIYLVSWGSTKSSGTPMLGLYDFTNSKTIFEMDSDNIGRSVYRVYGFKKQ